MNLRDQNIQGFQGYLNGQGIQQQEVARQLQRLSEKDPTVSSAGDALMALKKRKSELETNLSKVDGWKAELARVERMIAAGEP